MSRRGRRIPRGGAGRRPRRWAAAAAAIALLPAGCTVGPDFRRPSAPTPAHWPLAALQPAAIPGAVPGPATGSAVGEQTAQLAQWWRGFDDATLDALIERSLRDNLDLRTAVLRYEEAQQQLLIAGAGRWVSVSANASATRNRISESTPQGSLLSGASRLSIPGVGAFHIPNPYDQFQLGAAASWQIDLFGRLSRSIEAANATLQASLEDRRAVQVSLLAQVAQSYLALRGAQARKAVALQDLATIDELVQLTQQRRAAGLTTDLDVEDALAQRSQTRASLPQLDLAITQALHQLGVLLGQTPEALRGELAAAAPIPPVPPQVPIGLPAALARRRPDIRRAEDQLHAATAQVGVAIADLFPRLTLTGSGGFQAVAPGTLLHWASLFGSVGPALDIPVFNRGSWQTVQLQRLRAQQAALGYRAAVLTALREVEDAVAAYEADQRQRQWLADSVAHNRAALQIARQRYESGVSAFLNVLDAQRTLQQNQLALIASTTAVSSDLVALYRALGGGWQPPLPAGAPNGP